MRQQILWERVILALSLSQGETYKIVLLQIGGILLLIAGVTSLVYYTGGLKFVYSHAMYLPILMAGFRFGLLGGFLAGILGGLCLGPFMPLTVQPFEAQALHAWVYRSLFFVIIGLVAGGGCALHRLQMFYLADVLKDMTSTFTRTLRSLAKAIEAKDPYTIGHGERVANNALEVGKRLGLGSNELAQLYWAGLLHDLGKIGVPEAILFKKTSLNPSEMARIARHPELGDEMLSNISPFYRRISDGIRSHHERWDGSGYPDNLSGKEIPLSGRILAVCDVYDALTSERSYREPLGREEALQYIVQGAGKFFDPQVAENFLKCLDRFCQENGAIRHASPFSDLQFRLVWDYYLGDRPHSEIFRRMDAAA